jgi:hypothetical protein
MFRLVRPVVWIAILAISFLHSTAGQATSPLEGTWRGKLDIVDTKGSASYDRTKAAIGDTPFTIAIHGQAANVYFGETEVKPTSFQTQIYLTNAVVFASDTGNQGGLRWVETWNFTLTQKDPETLIVCFSRVVNNLDLAEEVDHSKFYVLAVGEFRRTSR